MLILLSNVTGSLNRLQFFERKKKSIHLTEASQVTIIVKNNSLEAFWDLWSCLHTLRKTVCCSSGWQHISDWTLALWADYLIFFFSTLSNIDYRESLLVNLALAGYEIKNIFVLLECKTVVYFCNWGQELKIDLRHLEEIWERNICYVDLFRWNQKYLMWSTFFISAELNCSASSICLS